jgi:glucose-1-phosphate adenylyltransferase
MRYGPDWFQGTADSVFQNLNLLRQHKPGLVAVFGADHIYRMDIRQMIDFHLINKADVTVAARPVPMSDAGTFGIMEIEADGRIKGFEEKPEYPAPMPSDPDNALGSMGNYIFNADILKESLMEAQSKEEHDFGSNVIPNILKNGKRLFAYDFTDNDIPGVRGYEENGYWRDVGAIKAFWDAHQDMLGEKPLFEIHNELWPVRPPRNELPAAKIMSGEISNSIIAEGAVINNAKIVNSFIRRGTIIEEGAEVRDSIIMDRVVVRKGASLNKTIVDSYNVIEEGVSIGEGSSEPYWRAYTDPSGITVIASEKRTSEL